MKLEMSGQMRLEQKMKLAPRMIQSMEILQLPILALQERIEQELNSNPVLEVEEPARESDVETSQQDELQGSGEDLPSDIEGAKTEDFDRLSNLDDDYKEYMGRSEIPRRNVSDEQADRKLEAIKNTEANPQSLHSYLTGQWGLVEAPEAIKKAGTKIIDYIDDRGYLTVRLEQLHTKDEKDFTFDDLKQALKFVQNLEPLGVGSRDIKECLLIQLAQRSGDTTFEQRIIVEYMEELLDNRLPEIAKKMNRTTEEIKHAIENMRKLDTSPGLQVGQSKNHIITADVIVELSEDGEDYIISLADNSLPSLKVSDYYAKMSKDAKANAKTKKFLRDNIRSAQWIIEAIEQRKNTLLRVTRAVVKYQREFFDNGQLYLKPLPMAKVADDVGVHLATVSRAVSGKYVQCYWGILPLRKFFSGGTEDTNGHAHSWEAIRGKLQQIMDAENKSKPLSDDQIRKKLAEAGIENLARRTVAKYRKLLNVPAARMRKKY